MSRALTSAEEQRVIQLLSSQLLDEHSDVSVSGPTDGFVLTWVTANDQWEALATSGSGVDHGSLSGLLDDDHPQYLLADRELIFFYEGASIDQPEGSITEAGGTVTFNLENEGGGDIRFIFDVTAYTLDCTPICTVALTNGTDTAPILNYVYVTESGGTLTLEKSTTGFPSTAHAPIATVLVQSASGVSTDGAYKFHSWTDHVNDTFGNGHLSHINEKLRSFGAGWQSGTAPTDLISNQISTTAGVVFQLHAHAFPARDMSTGDPIFVANDNTTPYKRITSFGSGGIDSLSDGTSIGNGKYVNIVVWGVMSDDDEATCKLITNLPDDQYTTSASAQTDDRNTAAYGFGSEFVGTGFLIARYTLQYSTGSGGSFTQVLKTDLRGLFPSSSPGGGAITDHGNLSGLTNDDHTQYSLNDGSRLGIIQLGDSTSPTVPGTYGDVTWNQSRKKSGNFTHDNLGLNPEEITCDVDGCVKVDVNISFDYSSGSGNIVFAKLQIDTGGGFADVPDTERQEQVASSGSAQISINLAIDVSAGDILKVQWDENGGVCTAPTGQRSFSAHYLSVT